MRRISFLTVGLCGLLIFLVACGSTQPGSTLSAPPTVPPGENLYVLDGYTSASAGGQRIVAFHPGDSTSIPLPAGLISQDHQRIYTTTNQNGKSIITVTNTKTGKPIRTFPIPRSSYPITGQDYTKAVISSDGHWLALRQDVQSQGGSVFALVDTETGQLVKNFQVNGNFDLDAVSPNGSRVYLLERLNDSSGHYYVRLYDVNKSQLAQGIVADKSELNDPRMVGSALTRQMASDGTRAYTLYTDTRGNIAFVHILPLASDYNGARCINLPAGKSADLLHYYTLALSSDSSTLYATNAALGVMIAINVSDKDAFSDQIQTTVHFNPGNVQVTNDEMTHTLHNGAVLSPDQSTLYVAGMHGIVAIDIAGSKVKSSYATQQVFTSIALSADGQTVYAVSPNNGITLINTGSGQTRQITRSPVHTPWGIEWISN